MIIRQKIIESLEDNSYSPPSGNYIYVVGVQGTPGTTFTLTGSISINPNDEIVIGPSGIYQVNLSDPLITAITITKMVGNLPVIIDVIYGPSTNSNNSEEEVL